MPSRRSIAVLAGIGLTTVSFLPIPFAAILAHPGDVVASTIWFRVLQRGTIPNPNVWHWIGFAFVVYATTFAFWAGLTYAVLVLRARRDHAVSALRHCVRGAAILIVCIPVSFILTLLLLPLWNWLENTFGIESVGHSGPDDWCFWAPYAACVGAGALAVYMPKHRTHGAA